MAKEMKERKIVLTIPEMGLTKSQINTLKRRFKNEVVNSLGGPEALAARRTVVVVVVVVVRF